MTRRLVLTTATLVVMSCSGGGADTPAPPQPAPAETIAGIVIAPSTVSLQAGSGATAQLTATVTGSRGSTLTGQSVSWSSSDPSKASVSATGLVTAIAAGQATITASAGGQNGTALVTVTLPPETVAGVAVSPAVVSLQAGIGATAQLTATVTGSRGSTLTGQSITWTSSDPSRASVSATGVVTALAAGQVTITASTGGQVGTAAVTITPPPAFRLTVDAGMDAVPLGLARRLTATVRDSAGGTVMAPLVAWRSSDTTIATAAAGGLLVSRRAGSATVTAAYTAGSRQFTGQTSVTIGSAPPIAACRLPNRTGSVGFGFPRSNARLRPTGTVRATMVFVDFSDGPATRTPRQVFDLISPNPERFFAAVSHGAMTLELQPNLRWLRMSRPSTQYAWPNNPTFQGHLEFLQEAATLAAPTTDFSQTDLLVVITNPDAPGILNGPALVANPGTGIRVPGRTTTIDNATNSARNLAWGWGWLVHEMGHLLSLPDLYDYAPPAGRGISMHVGHWSQMGLISGRGPEWTAFERWQLGWLSDAQMVCAPKGTSIVELTPLELTGGTKATLIPLSATLAVVVESRRAIGYDAGLPQPGPLVYFIDTSVANGRGTMRVLPIDDADVVKLTRTLQLGQTITHEGASVTLLSRTDGSDVVQVVRP